MKKFVHQLRINRVPDFKDRCCVCGDIGMGCHFDHDLAAMSGGRGYVCNECSGFVIVAEQVLIDRGIYATPTSLMEDGK